MTAPTIEQDRIETPTVDLANQTVVLDLKIQKPSFKAKVNSADALPADEQVDPALIHVSKDLIDRDALKEIGGAESDFKRWLKNRAIACSMLRGGMTLVPLPLVEDVDRRFAAFRAERYLAVQALVSRYDELKRSAQERLGKHYNEDDYPPAEEIQAAFGTRIRFLSFDVPAALKSLNRDLYRRERERVEAEWSDAAEEIREALREAMMGLVERMADRLGSEDGKPKTFRDSTVESFQDFLSTFSARNLTGDTELEKLAEQARGILAGVKADNLRKQETTRERVKRGMDEIKASLERMDVKPATRKFGKKGEV